jgi:hypothetical protein
MAAIAATVLLLRWPRLHPLVLFAAGGAMFGLSAYGKSDPCE